MRGDVAAIASRRRGLAATIELILPWVEVAEVAEVERDERSIVEGETLNASTIGRRAAAARMTRAITEVLP